jgi:hypothetical protein
MRTVRAASHHPPVHGDARRLDDGDDPSGVDTTEGAPASFHIRLARAGGGEPGSRTSKQGSRPQGTSTSKLSCWHWNQQSGARDDDEGRQRSARARQRLLQPTRCGRSIATKRCEALPSDAKTRACTLRGWGTVGRAWHESIEAGLREGGAILPDSSNRANGIGPGQGRSHSIEDARLVSCARDGANRGSSVFELQTNLNEVRDGAPKADKQNFYGGDSGDRVASVPFGDSAHSSAWTIDC